MQTFNHQNNRALSEKYQQQSYIEEQIYPIADVMVCRSLA